MGQRQKKPSRGWKLPKIDHKPVIFGGSLPAQALTSYLTTAEVAAKMGVSERRVRELIRKGRLTAFKKGKGYLIHREAFYAFNAIKRRAGRPGPGETLAILRVSSTITIQSVQQGTDGPTPVESGDEDKPAGSQEA